MPDEPFAFVVVSDSRTKDHQEAVEADLQQIRDWLDYPTPDMPAPSFLVFSGDFDHTWQMAESIATLLGADFVWFPIVGNSWRSKSTKGIIARTLPPVPQC